MERRLGVLGGGGWMGVAEGKKPILGIWNKV